MDSPFVKMGIAHPVANGCISPFSTQINLNLSVENLVVIDF